ncbi:malonyl-CoA decarboxylase, mitochondrial isoform X1 [Ipomoea triloba]|uniref:malonyl-CoA decarboxylase, mitochondrial isoform X1 n=1 Tax=Ipomoea triloba TaxID=35885 RepID=UPI00125E5893|nr:malonyl-CoA decarboxylase, mitochondrial isoform X1 [Ipomoea triloba]XP_031126438.1 malonyl-CoA decarboxylase, mitochondrial isoform X1 [Ipomoea triloba]
MNKKGLAILMRTKVRPLSPAPNKVHKMQLSPQESSQNSAPIASFDSEREFARVRESMISAMLMSKTESLDAALDEFSEGYVCLSHVNRQKLLHTLARDYDLNRALVRELMKQYLDLQFPSDKAEDSGLEEEGSLSAFYRIERNLRYGLKPMYEMLFERLNTHPGGLKFLSDMRADILLILNNENVASLRALDSYLKEKLVTWLSPANLELHNITWDDPASLLEKIVAYEAVHPISNLIDLKRRLGVGRRCFGYFHPAIPGEPLIFIEVALMKDVAQRIQEVLWDDPPILECDASCALFYSISSTQPGLSGINLGKFLIKRVIDVVKKDMPNISTFATLSPIPGYMQWLLSKLASSERSGSAFRENLLEPDEETAILNASGESGTGRSGMEVMRNLLASKDHEWTNSEMLISVLRIPLMRLCARYLLNEKKRGKALDSVANFHLQNGAMVGRLNWMADRSVKGLNQSGGIMVNYIYRLENIEENAQSYMSGGHIQASSDVRNYVGVKCDHEGGMG